MESQTMPRRGVTEEALTCNHAMLEIQVPSSLASYTPYKLT